MFWILFKDFGQTRSSVRTFGGVEDRKLNLNILLRANIRDNEYQKEFTERKLCLNLKFMPFESSKFIQEIQF